MKPPKLQGADGTYLIVWEEERMSARVNRIREERGTLTAEVKVLHHLLEKPTHLHQARLNLMSTGARRTFANQLTSRWSVIDDWDGAVEALCILVAEDYRQGQPVISIADIPERERLEYRVNPLIVNQEANLWYGPGGTGKSLAACFVSVLVDLPTSGAGMDSEPGNVLYLDYETSPEEIRDRIRSIQNGLGFPVLGNVKYRFCHRPLVDEIEIIRESVLANQTDLLIIDSIGTACGGEPESADTVLRYFSALRSLRLSTLTIDHTNKEGNLFGSVYKTNSARSVFEMKKAQEQEDSFIEVGFYHRKVNNGKLVAPRALRFTFKGDSTIVTAADIKSSDELRKGLSQRVQAKAILARGAISTVGLAEQLGTTEGAIRALMNRYKDDFIRAPNNTWGLPAQERA